MLPITLSHPLKKILVIYAIIGGILMTLVGTLPLSSQAASKECPSDALLLGMSTSLTGTAAHLGTSVRSGVEAALHEFNNKTNQKPKLCLKVLDDGYEPALTVPNILTLIKEDDVLAIIGNVGTPTAIAAAPVANRLKTPFIGAFTGAGVLRKQPPDHYIINYRASYAEETAEMVSALILDGGLTPNEIGFFTQRDASGDAGFNGGIAALKKFGLQEETSIVHGRYERNTLAVENAIADLLLAEPPIRAVIMVGAYDPSASFIRLAKKYGLDCLFLNVSFVGAVPFAQKLGKHGENVIITQVVPHFKAALPLVEDFRKALKTYDQHATFSFSALEGYISARILLLALDSISGPVSRSSIINALENLNEFDLGLGIPLRLGPNHHQASHKVWPTIIQQGNIVEFDWQHLKGLL